MKNITIIIAFVLVAGLCFGQGTGTTPPGWYPDDGLRVLTYRALSTGNGTTTLAFNDLIGTRFDYIGCIAWVIYDAGGAGAAPQGEFREITAFNDATGVITVVTAFTALGAGDMVWIGPSVEAQTLWGTAGVPAVTAAEFAAGVSIAEGLLDINNDLDTLRSEVVSTTGIATFPTGVFHANGVSIAENAAWQSDTLRKIGVTTDSALAYIHSTTGMPAVTGAFPAAGVSLSEKVQFLADSLRKVAVSTDSTLFYLHSTTGAPAVTGAFPAAGLSINERIQYIADSLRKVAVTTDTVYSYLLTATGAQWGTAAEPANGVNLLEGIGFAQNQLDSIVGGFYGTVGLPAQTGAFNAAGVSLAESQQWQSDSLRRAFVQITTIVDSLEDANDHLQALRGVTTGHVDASVWSYVSVVVNFAAAGAWEEAASTHELFTVTGAVEFEITAYCSTDVAVTSADSIFFLNGGDAGVTAAGSVYRCLGTDIDAFEGLFRGVRSSTGAAVIPTAAILAGNGGDAWCGTSMGGMDIGYDIDDNDFTGGIIVFYCKWRPITTSSTVVAGAGAAL